MDNKVYVADEPTALELTEKSQVETEEDVKKPGCCGGFFDEEEKKEDLGPKVGFFELWKFATKTEIMFLLIGVVAAVVHGAMMPLLFLFFGDLIDGFIDGGANAILIEGCKFNFTISSNVTEYANCCLTNGVDCEATLSSTNMYVIYWIAGLGGLALICGSIHAGLFSFVAHKQEQKIKVAYFKAIVRQEMAFYETEATPGELNAHLADDIGKIRNAINDKVSASIQFLSQGVTGFAIGFVYSWQLALVICAAMPVLMFVTVVGVKAASKITSSEQKAYAEAAEVANEVILSIRTVNAFCAQKMELFRYDRQLLTAKNMAIKVGITMGISFGVIYGMIYAMYALSFGFGTWLFQESLITPGGLIICFFGIIIAAFSISQAGSNFESFVQGQAAAHHVFKTIDRVSKIDPLSEEGTKLEGKEVSGEVSLTNVKFSYPSRPDLEVLKGIDMTIKPGETVAFVGPSGCGKSTIIQLLQRFYDVDSGEIKIDEHDVKNINVKSLRSIIGIVKQEPTLFATTIGENIRFGKEDATRAEIEAALQAANAISFVNKFDKGLDTQVGDKGGHLSGGQKQRIAIARALISDPKILLLDEATSALDAESEKIVQDALDKASRGRTTIIIAHRLSTVRNADRIFGIRNGEIVEVGSHEELYQKENGLYKALVDAQLGGEAVEKLNNDKLETNETEKVELNKKVDAEEEEEVTGETEDELPEVTVWEVLEFNKPEYILMGFGLIVAMLAGTTEPINAILFADVLGAYAMYGNNMTELWKVIWGYIGGFLGIALGALVVHTLRSAIFFQTGALLIRRVRFLYFKALMRQEIAFYDDPKFPSGVLTSRLATDCSKLAGMTGSRISALFQAVGAGILALIVGFIYSWELTLLCFLFVPLMMLAGMIEVRQTMVNKDADADADKTDAKGSCSAIAFEVTNNIETVASLHKENYFLERFCAANETSKKGNRKSALLRGFAHGYSQSMMFFSMCAVFRLGLFLVDEKRITFDAVFKVLMAVMFGSMQMGQAMALAPDYAEALLAARRVFFLFNKKSKCDPESKTGRTLDKVEGKIEFKNVHFTYPHRPDMKVLKGINLTIQPGESLALVGQSGCGKSTLIQLIERFYDPDEGEILLDGVNTKDLNLNWLRKNLGFVQQEPVLMNRSIADNIRQGQADILGDVIEATYEHFDKVIHVKAETDEFKGKTSENMYPIDQVVECAKSANIDDFIQNQAHGYETNVGRGGGSLSGGQKQRVAIARTLMMKPSILLLDEATSALDAESEIKINEALDEARQDRTVVMIAHRLSTVRTADRIACIDFGQVVETGTHAELIAKKSVYFNLVKAQL